MGLSRDSVYDAVVVGSGPNGLVAAIELARAGKSVLVVEASETIGGGSRSAELTLPGFVHDVCSAIHPLAVASPALKDLPLERHGLRMIQPSLPLAHPLDDGTAVVLDRSVGETARGLDEDDAAYTKLMTPLVASADDVVAQVLGPLRVPRHPFSFARFGLGAVRSATGLAAGRFDGPRARALFAGIAAHAMMRLSHVTTAAYGLTLAALAHSVGWPLAEGGSQRIADALAAHLRSLGGELTTGFEVTSLDQLPSSGAVLFDLGPHQVARIAGAELPARYRRRLLKFRYGMGVFKADFALDGPIPWKAPECEGAGTVHLGGTLEEIAASEDAVTRGRHAERPYVLLAQQSLFDPSRAPGGRHTVWAYCHVPNGSAVDMTVRIEDQIERFAPGFRDRILARSAIPAAAYQRYNANYVGGDINGGTQDLRQLFTRPVARINPYTTPNRRLYICSSSTPPGGGVHGMCGHYAARAALKRAF
jgi:phytoene dehydrogenase-like protein